MGELMPFLICGFVVLLIVVGVIAKNGSRKAVVKPIEQTDLVERVKIRLNHNDAFVLRTNLDHALADIGNDNDKTFIVDHYEKETDRLIRFEISYK